MLDSRLSECVAGLIFAFPDPAENAAVLPQSRRHGIRKQLCEAARRAAATMLRMARLRVLLQKLQDAKGWELATYLHRAARHTNVQLLQVGRLGLWRSWMTTATRKSQGVAGFAMVVNAHPDT